MQASNISTLHEGQKVELNVANGDRGEQTENVVRG